MYVRDPIENDAHYKRLSKLVFEAFENRADAHVFLSSFESWYHSQSYSIYQNLSEAAIQSLEESLNA